MREAGGWSARPLLAAALLATAVSFAPIASHSLWTPDEPTGAAVGRGMLSSGDYIVPRLGGQPFLEKPPLYWWVQAAGYRLLGARDWTARLPSALFAVASLLAAYALGRRVGGPAVGLATVAVLATTAEWSEDMGRAVVDPALVCFVTLAHLGFAGLAAPTSPADRRRSTLLIAVALPLAFLSKGIVGIGLAAAPPVLYLLATERRRGLRRLLPLAALGVPVFALLVAPWAWALARDGGWAALRETLVGNTVGRLLATQAGRVYGHRRPFVYYLENAPGILFPWIFAFPALLAAGVMRRQASGPEAVAGSGRDEATARRLLFTTFLIGVALLSAAASKRGLYLVPLLPAFAACVAWWLMREGAGAPGRWDRPTRRFLLALGALLPILVWAAAAWVRLSPPRALADLAPLRQALSPARLAAAGALAALVSGAAVARFLLARFLLRRGDPERTPERTDAGRGAAWLVAPYLLVFLAVQTAGKAAVDPVKDLHALTAAIARLAPGPGPVPLYVPAGVPTDSIFGILDFDLGRLPERLATPAEVAGFFAAHPGSRLALSLESARQLPPALRDHLVLVYDESGKRASPWAVAERRR
jgi:4-amino-4-deoxy-L-arabinose transferase-like glycosyltransferase